MAHMPVYGAGWTVLALGKIPMTWDADIVTSALLAYVALSASFGAQHESRNKVIPDAGKVIYIKHVEPQMKLC